MLFEVKKQLEHGTKNPIVARLMLQTLELLGQSSLSKEKTDKIGEIFVSSLVKKLLRYWEIKERLELERTKARASYKPPGRNEPAAHVPQIPKLEEECHNFLYEAKNFLRDLVTVFNLLHGTNFKEEASSWASPSGEPGLLMTQVAKTYGDDHINTRFIRQLPACIAPYVAMRNAVEHPKGHSGELKIENIAIGADGKLVDAQWRREKDAKIVYGPLDVIQELTVGVNNLLVLAEDILVMVVQAHLATPDATVIAAIPERARNPECHQVSHRAKRALDCGHCDHALNIARHFPARYRPMLNALGRDKHRAGVESDRAAGPHSSGRAHSVPRPAYGGVLLTLLRGCRTVRLAGWNSTVLFRPLRRAGS